ncbi:MAG: prolipoprotein diacylglyceryl transferase [Anaerolineales bacterium]|nr:prolipoprotein diacylglyceryl transferase [Anaerolineales bacterium]
MLPVLQLGPLAVPVPALTLLLGVWGALWLAERAAGRLGLNPEALSGLIGVALIAGLPGARLVFAVQHWSAYAADPLGLFSFTSAALAPLEGALIAVVAAAVYGARRRLPLRPTLDALAPAVALMAVALALAHLASGDAFGAPTGLPWRVFLWGEYRHPTQIYELLAALAVLAVACLALRRAAFPGFVFLLVMALLAVARLALEAFRGDSLVVLGGWRVAQLWGLFVLAVCLALMRRWSLGSLPSASSPSPGNGLMDTTLPPGADPPPPL